MTKSIEVEVRILLKNRPAVEREIKKRGAKMVYFEKLKDYWYCPNHAKNFEQASTDKTGFALRIRKSIDNYTGKQTATLECKTLCNGKDHAMCNEYCVDLQDTDQMRKILQSIGLREFLVINKERTIYQLDETKFCFDDIEGVGRGLEIEIMTRTDVEKTHQRLVNLALDLGIAKQEILEKSLTYLAMKKLAKF